MVDFAEKPLRPQRERRRFVVMDNGTPFYLWVIGITEPEQNIDPAVDSMEQ